MSAVSICSERVVFTHNQTCNLCGPQSDNSVAVRSAGACGSLQPRPPKRGVGANGLAADETFAANGTTLSEKASASLR